MHTAFRPSAPFYTFPLISDRPRCRWVVDPVSRKLVALWIFEDEHLISFK